jgi:hypothetical protein
VLNPCPGTTVCMATNSAYKEWATQTLSASMSMLLVVSSSSSSIVVVAESRGQSEHKMKLIKLGIRILRVYVCVQYSAM